MNEIVGWSNDEIIGAQQYIGGPQAFIGDSDIERLMAMGADPAVAAALPPTAARTVSVVQAQQGLWKKHYLPLNLINGVTSVAAGGSGTLSNSPQRLFKPTRLIIPSDIAGLFSVTQISIGVKAQLVANGSIPARLFSEQSFDSGFEGDTAQVSQQINVAVTNNSLGASPISGGMRGLTVM